MPVIVDVVPSKKLKFEKEKEFTNSSVPVDVPMDYNFLESDNDGGGHTESVSSQLENQENISPNVSARLRSRNKLNQKEIKILKIHGFKNCEVKLRNADPIFNRKKPMRKYPKQLFNRSTKVR